MNRGFFLGIYHGHNATVAVLDDEGNLLDCISEERFRSVKNYSGFPTETIRYILNKYEGKEILGVGLPFEFMNSVFLTSIDGTYRETSGISNLLWRIRVAMMHADRGLHDNIYNRYNSLIGKRNAKKQIKLTADRLNLNEFKVVGYNHQLCHAYSAYYLSPFNGKDALVLTLDGEGDGLCATVSTVKRGKFKTISTTPLGNSLGWIYMDLTKYMGMRPNEHEYKIMGLAPYAKEEHVDKVYEKIKDWLEVDGLEFRSKFDTHLSYEFMQKTLQGYRFDNIAGAFQKLVEERIVEWVANAIKHTKLDTVCCGGGVFMNVKANMCVSKLKTLKNLWVMPSCGDDSTPMGSAIASYKEYCERSRRKFSVAPIKDLYLGPAYSNETIKDFIKQNKLTKKYSVTRVKDISKKIAQLLSKGEVVANMSGRMEWGARALGNRSILANPSKPDVIREINEYVKNRDFWMPFAGSILEERAKDYIKNPKNIASDYMIMTYESTPLAVAELRNAMHPYDFTIRPQIVRKDWNMRYYNIIKEFEKLTGIGGVLNTSFNLHGLPIALGPAESLHVFENSEIKHLVLEDFLISKSKK